MNLRILIHIALKSFEYIISAVVLKSCHDAPYEFIKNIKILPLTAGRDYIPVYCRYGACTQRFLHSELKLSTF